jgi:hypothetical protein
MKQTDIKVGLVYRNRGAGTTQRKVIGVGPEFRPGYGIRSMAGDRVEYRQKQIFPAGSWSNPRRTWLDRFASWAGSEVTE